MIDPNKYECAECGIKAYKDEEWKERADGDLVCEECASGMPTFSCLKKYRPEGSDEPVMYFAEAWYRLGDESERCETGYFFTRTEARARICHMTDQLWGHSQPIEEEE